MQIGCDSALSIDDTSNKSLLIRFVGLFFFQINNSFSAIRYDKAKHEQIILTRTHYSGIQLKEKFSTILWVIIESIHKSIYRTKQKIDGNVSQTHKSLFYGVTNTNHTYIINENTHLTLLVFHTEKGKRFCMLLIYNIIGYRHILLYH